MSMPEVKGGVMKFHDAMIESKVYGGRGFDYHDQTAEAAGETPGPISVVPRLGDE